MCIEENCKNKFLCFDCFKTHDNCFKTNDNNDYKDLLSSNEKITQIETDNKKTNISFYIDLELKRKDSFKIKFNLLIKTFLDQFLSITSEFQTNLLDSINIKEDDFKEEIKKILDSMNNQKELDVKDLFKIFNIFKALQEIINTNFELDDEFLTKIDLCLKESLDYIKKSIEACLFYVKDKRNSIFYGILRKPIFNNAQELITLKKELVRAIVE